VEGAASILKSRKRDKRTSGCLARGKISMLWESMWGLPSATYNWKGTSITSRGHRGNRTGSALALLERAASSKRQSIKTLISMLTGQPISREESRARSDRSKQRRGKIESRCLWSPRTSERSEVYQDSKTSEITLGGLERANIEQTWGRAREKTTAELGCRYLGRNLPLLVPASKKKSGPLPAVDDSNLARSLTKMRPPYGCPWRITFPLKSTSKKKIGRGGVVTENVDKMWARAHGLERHDLLV